MKVVKGNFGDKAAANKQQSEKTPEKTESFPSPSDEDIYSRLLMELVSPFLPDPYEAADLESMLELAVIANNMAITRSLKFPEFDLLFNNTIDMVGLDEDEEDIVNKMMLDKDNRFQDMILMIDNFDVDYGKAAPEILVSRKPFLEYMASLEELEEDHEYEDEYADEENDIIRDQQQFLEGSIDRGAITIKPTHFFWDWCKEKDPLFKIPEGPLEYNNYLIAPFESTEEMLEILKNHYKVIHSMETVHWTEINFSAKDAVDFNTFLKMFRYETRSYLYDLERAPVLKYGNN